MRLKNPSGRARLLAVALLFCAGCGETPPDRKAEAAPAGEYAQNLQRFFDEDARVLRAALDDLVALEEFRRYPSQSTKDEIVIWNRSNGSSGFVSPGQVSSELREQQRVPSGLFEELQSRNHKEIPLDRFEPGGTRFRLEPTMSEPADERRFGAFERKYPKAGAHVGFWLPAYTSDGRTALVRFSFGPTAHGACGTALLEKRDGRWTVAWRKLAYYA